VNNIIKESRLIEGNGIFSVKRLSHVNPIQPHLEGIDFLVPEAAARVSFPNRPLNLGRSP